MTTNIIFVPDMDATALTAFAKKQCKLRHFGELYDKSYETWDYWLDVDKKPICGRGKHFEVLTWYPGRFIPSEEVRLHFQERGFYGHVAAFTAWLAKHSPRGDHVTLPEDKACWHGSDTDSLICFPYSRLDGAHRTLRVRCVKNVWNTHVNFVAFRELED